VAERSAIQSAWSRPSPPIGDKALLAEVAQNMNLVSLFRGKEAGAILSEVAGRHALPARAAGGAREEGVSLQKDIAIPSWPA